MMYMGKIVAGKPGVMTDAEKINALVDLLEKSNRRLEEAVLLLERYAAIAEIHLSERRDSTSFLFPERGDYSRRIN